MCWNNMTKILHFNFFSMDFCKWYVEKTWLTILQFSIRIKVGSCLQLENLSYWHKFFTVLIRVVMTRNNFHCYLSGQLQNVIMGNFLLHFSKIIQWCFISDKCKVIFVMCLSTTVVNNNWSNYPINLFNAAAADEIVCSRNWKPSTQNNSLLIHSKWMKQHWINFQHFIHANDII